MAQTVQITTTHKPSTCTAVLGFAESAVEIHCELPRHRGRHQAVIPGETNPRKVVIKWEDDKPERP